MGRLAPDQDFSMSTKSDNLFGVLLTVPAVIGHQFRLEIGREKQYFLLLAIKRMEISLILHEIRCRKCPCRRHRQSSQMKLWNRNGIVDFN